jgi:hypothetical protein
VTLGALAAIVVLATSSVAQAEASQADKITARALFDEGRRLVGEGKHAEACPKFEESRRLDPGIGTMFNLADCLEATGKTASAWSVFLETAARLKAEGGAPEKEQAARKRAAALEPKLSKLKIVVPESAQVDGLVVKRDGSPQGRGAWGVSIPVDPGVHVIEAVAPGRRRWVQSIELAKAGADVTVTVAPLELGAEAAGPPVTPMPVPPEQREQPAPDRGPVVDKPVPAPRGPRVHDGLYLRLGLGGGVQAGAVAHSESRSDGYESAPDQSVTGTSGMVELALGYAVRPGLNLGGGLYLEQNGGAASNISGEVAPSGARLGTHVLVGPMLDWYFRPQKGFHMLAALGVASAQQRTFMDVDGNKYSSASTGLGGLIGLGYDWWVSDQWSLGLLGRGALSITVDEKDGNAVQSTATFGVLMTATYN